METKILLIIGITIGVAVIGLIFIISISLLSLYRTNKEIEIAQQERKENPTKITPLFDELQSKFERYIDSNQKQNRIIPAFTIVIIFLGFVMVCIGIFYGKEQTDGTFAGKQSSAVIAGLITQFIAGTILVVYKTIFQQTVEYFRTVERMISIGLSVKIIDDLPEDQPESKDMKTKAKIEISKILLEMHREWISSSKASESSQTK